MKHKKQLIYFQKVKKKEISQEWQFDIHSEIPPVKIEHVPHKHETMPVSIVISGVEQGNKTV